jgi:hypothetical protein
MSEALIAEIRKRWSPQDGRCGRLIQRRLVHGHGPFSTWHYGVALSDSWAISWGPKSGDIALLCDGRLKVHHDAHEFRNATAIVHLPLPEICANLIASATAFHRKWLYGVHGWNCEHWARLVTSGKAKSYQVKKVIPDRGRNREAESRLDKHKKRLQQHSAI